MAARRISRLGCLAFIAGCGTSQAAPDAAAPAPDAAVAPADATAPAPDAVVPADVTVAPADVDRPAPDATPPETDAPDASTPEADAPEGAGDVTGGADVTDAPDSGVSRCEVTAEGGWSTIPEASGAVRFPDGRLLVVADSGHHGRALWIGPDGVETPLTLPLDGPRDAEGRPTDDDLEGLSLGPAGDLFGLTSAGWLRRWRRVGDGFELVGASTPISDSEALACASRAVNCGPNFEGLCLRPGPDATPPPVAPVEPSGCAGFAASKARSELVCLAWTADPAGGPPRLLASGLVIPTGVPADHLSDCAFPSAPEGAGALMLAGNLYAGSELWWFEPASRSLSSTGLTGPANQEAVTSTGPGRWRAFGDLQSLSPASPWTDLICEGP